MSKQKLSQITGKIAQILKSTEAKYCLLGGLAVVLHGYIRATRDVDFLVEGLDSWEPILLEAKSLGLELREQDKELADEGLLFLRGLQDPSFGVDLLRVESTFEHELLGRTESHSVDNVDIPVIALEDLILLKLSVGRPQDDADAEALIQLRRTDIDEAKMQRLAQQLGIESKFQTFWGSEEE